MVNTDLWGIRCYCKLSFSSMKFTSFFYQKIKKSLLGLKWSVYDATTFIFSQRIRKTDTKLINGNFTDYLRIRDEVVRAICSMALHKIDLFLTIQSIATSLRSKHRYFSHCRRFKASAILSIFLKAFVSGPTLSTLFEASRWFFLIL